MTDMSMLSAQCDELRAMAESVGMAVPQAATLMMGAADAIERLEVENAKLRELVASLTDRSIRIADKMDCLEAENRKLRELARDMFYAVHPADREKFLTNVAELGVEVDG